MRETRYHIFLNPVTDLKEMQMNVFLSYYRYYRLPVLIQSCNCS